MSAIEGIAQLMQQCNQETYKTVQKAMLKRPNRQTVRESNLIACHSNCCVKQTWEDRRLHNNQLHIDNTPIMEVGEQP